MVASGSSDLKRWKSLAWCAFWKLEQLWKSPHIYIATKVKLFNSTCVTILLYGCKLWVISQDMENKINAFATSCYRVMLNIKRIDHVLNITVYSMTNTVPLFHLVRHRQLKFLGHILRMSKEEPARRYALYIPTIGKRRPGRPRTSYLNYVQRLLGDNEGAMQDSRLPHLLMIVMNGETLWSPAPQLMDDDDDDDDDCNQQVIYFANSFFFFSCSKPWWFLHTSCKFSLSLPFSSLLALLSLWGSVIFIFY